MKHTARLSVVFALSLLFIGCSFDDERQPASECSNDSVCAVVEMVNEERSEAGVSLLAFNAELQLAAQLHAEDMEQNGYFSHDSQDGRNFSTRALDAGYSGFPAGENIANGQSTAEQVMNSWMNSPGHRGNILSDRFDEIGVGRAGNYWVQVFGSQR